MDEHITRHLLHAIHQGWRNPGDLAAIALAHLFEQCPVCREEFESWRRQVGEGVTRPEEGDYDATLDRFFREDGVESEELGSESARVDAQRRNARSRAEELLGLPAEEQLDWIRSESKGHAGPLLAEALIEESRRKAPGYPWEAIILANLARTVLQHSATTLFAAELFAQALGCLANAIRVTGDLPRSEQILLDARYFLRSQGGGDRLVRAELDSLEASLRTSQRRYRAAIKPLLRAHAVNRMDGEGTQTTVVLIQLGNVHRVLREHGRALTLLEEAQRLAENAGDPHLSALACGNQSPVLAEVGDLDSAWAELNRAKALDRPPQGSLFRLRYKWQEAILLEAGGDLAGSEAQLKSILRGYKAKGIRFAGAVIATKVGHLYFHQNRFADAEGLADEALQVFECVGVSRKAAEARHLRDLAASGRQGS